MFGTTFSDYNCVCLMSLSAMILRFFFIRKPTLNRGVTDIYYLYIYIYIYNERFDWANTPDRCSVKYEHSVSVRHSILNAFPFIVVLSARAKKQCVCVCVRMCVSS